MRFRHKRPKHIVHNPDGGANEHAHARKKAVEEPNASDALDAWIAELAAALGIDPTAIDRNLLLDVSRATHRVARAAAPFTLLFVGLAAGRDGGGVEAVNRAAATAQRLAAEHTPPAA
jgi:hypothetical protein